jgi:hypothetical protein
MAKHAPTQLVPPIVTDEAHHRQLIETAAAAGCHKVAVCFSRVLTGINSAAGVTPQEAAEMADAHAAWMAAAQALEDWRERHAA